MLKYLYMNKELLDIIDKIKEEIKNTNEYKIFLKCEEELNNSDEVKLLSYKKDMMIVEYEDALKHYNKNSKEVLLKEENLSKSIYNLNNHEIVKRYNEALNNLNKLYDKINKEIIDPLIK